MLPMTLWMVSQSRKLQLQLQCATVTVLVLPSSSMVAVSKALLHYLGEVKGARYAEVGEHC